MDHHGRLEEQIQLVQYARRRWHLRLPLLLLLHILGDFFFLEEIGFKGVNAQLRNANPIVIVGRQIGRL